MLGSDEKRKECLTDLLAALYQAVAFLDEMEAEGFVMDDARAAITKARGQ